MKLIAILLCGLVLHAQAWASIGEVILHEGNGAVERTNGDEETTAKALDIFSYDTVKTGNGKTAIEFVDQTRVDVTEHSKLIIDEFVYDPNTKTGALSLKASLGTVRYASGQIAKNSKQNVKISTPTATIAVRVKSQVEEHKEFLLKQIKENKEKRALEKNVDLVFD